MMFDATRRQRLIFLILAFGLSCLLARPVLAVEYGGMGGRPAYPRADNPRTDSIFVHTLSLGATQQEGVRVINNTAERKTILVYGTDSDVATGGAFTCKQKVDPKTDVGAWINLAKTEVTLEPNTNEIIPFTINVPYSADAGEHNGCIVMQEKKDAPDQQRGGIALSFRTGIRVAILIPGQINKNLEIVGFVLKKKANGSFLLTPSVRNTGNVSIDAGIKIKTSYFFGQELMSLGGGYPVLRGQTSEWNFELPRPFWGGWYNSRLEISYNKNTQGNIGESANQEMVTLPGPTVWFFSAPTGPAMIIEILVLLFIIILLIKLLMIKKKADWIKNDWVEYKVSAGDSLDSLALQYGVSWKLIAKANNLKPPYALTAKQGLKLPPINQTKVNQAKDQINDQEPVKKARVFKKKA